jgi:hypothetical protein
VTRSTVLDDFKVSLLPDNFLLKLPFKLLEACFHSWKASWIRVPHLTIIIQFLPNIVDPIFCSTLENVIQ